MIMKRLIFLSVAVILLSCQKNETINFDGITDPVYGTVTWSDGSPASEIQISDGFTITYTDSKGEYSIENRNVYAQWVYYSVPADAKLEIGQNGLPCFYKALERDNRRYDFTLTKAPVENRFRLLAIGDPQVRESNNGIHRLQTRRLRTSGITWPPRKMTCLPMPWLWAIWFTMNGTFIPV